MSDVTIESLLGGPALLGHEIHSEMDLYELGRVGLTKKSLLHLSRSIDMPVRVLSALLNVTERTLQRKNDNDLLNVETSEHILQIAEVYARGNEIFSANDDFHLWMNAPSVALGGKKPVDLLSSRYGAHMILDELVRMEYGVFA